MSFQRYNEYVNQKAYRELYAFCALSRGKCRHMCEVIFINKSRQNGQSPQKIMGSPKRFALQSFLGRGGAVK